MYLDTNTHTIRKYYTILLYTDKVHDELQRVFKILLILEPLICFLGYVHCKGRYFLLVDIVKEIENLYFQ